ncbi:MAG: aspartate kinase [bacterium]|nr:aspartate kinase [bacterium]
MKVSKFGGTSLADAAQIQKVCDIIAADPKRRLVVVSAPGKRHKDDIKVTDMMIACAHSFLSTGNAQTELDAVIDRYADIQNALELPGSIIEHIRADLTGRLAIKPDHPDHEARFVDLLKAAGEDNCARLVTEALRMRGMDAHYVSPKEAGMLLSDEYGNAQVLPQSYNNLRDLRNAPGVTVFPGFFGYTLSGVLATFPRGGSDITGSILAAAVGAETYENFTDVDSVFAVDPRIIPSAKPIPELTYREMRELSYAGFGVFHDEALIPVVKAGIPICIKNTNHPEAPGTMVLPERNHTPGEVAGIASDEGFCTLFVSKYMMNREVGFGRRLLQILENEGISYEHVPSGIDNTSVIIRENSFDGKVEQRVLKAIASELEADYVSVERGLALIMIVGEGLRYAIGAAARATRALAEAGVNIEMLNQGSSEISMMFGVKDGDRKAAVKAFYDEFFG